MAGGEVWGQCEVGSDGRFAGCVPRRLGEWFALGACRWRLVRHDRGRPERGKVRSAPGLEGGLREVPALGGEITQARRCGAVVWAITDA